MSIALETALKRLLRALIVGLVPVVIGVVLQWVQNDPIFTAQGWMLIQAVVVALLLAIDKWWRETQKGALGG